MNSINMMASARLGKAASKDPMSLFILGNALIDLKGLRTLIVRSALNWANPLMSNISTVEILTTMKSSQFQGSRRYEFL